MSRFGGHGGDGVHGDMSGGKGRGGGGGGKGGRGGKGGPKFNRQVPKFLQQYAHMLGAERPDAHANDHLSYQTTAVEEGYDSDGDKVVDQFLAARKKEKQDKEAAERAASSTAVAVVDTAPAEEETKVIFRPLKREVAAQVDGEVAAEGSKAAASKAKKPKKVLDNKKYYHPSIPKNL